MSTHSQMPAQGKPPLAPQTNETERLKMIIENPHNKAFHMRLTQKEYDNLHKNAKRAGLPLSTYMRHMMKACRPNERPPADWFKFYSQLRKIGNNLNQLTYIAHYTGDINAESYLQYRKDFSELLMALMDEFYGLEKLDAAKIVQEAKAQARQERQSA